VALMQDPLVVSISLIFFQSKLHVLGYIRMVHTSNILLQLLPQIFRWQMLPQLFFRPKQVIHCIHFLVLRCLVDVHTWW